MAKDLWPHADMPWLEISLGTILGCGNIKTKRRNPHDIQNARQEHGKQKGPTRLIQILISESAHLIWALRCERVIQERTLSEPEIKARWINAINRRLTKDKIIVTKIKHNKETARKVRSTWKPVLKKTQDLPNNWMQNREVLVGRRAGP
jgi:hypothetical protein